MRQGLGNEKGDGGIFGSHPVENPPLRATDPFIVDGGGLARPERAVCAGFRGNRAAGSAHDGGTRQTADDRAVGIQPAFIFRTEHGAFHIPDRVAQLPDLPRRHPRQRCAESWTDPPETREKTGGTDLDVATDRRFRAEHPLPEQLRIGGGDLEQTDAAVAAAPLADDLVRMRPLHAPIPRVDAREESAISPEFRSGRAQRPASMYRRSVPSNFGLKTERIAVVCGPRFWNPWGAPRGMICTSPGFTSRVRPARVNVPPPSRM